MLDNLNAKTYDLRSVSHINDNFVAQRNGIFKFKRPNCYMILNGMDGGNEAYMTIELIRGHYEECRIFGSLRKWYHGALSDKDLRWNEEIDAFTQLAEKLEISYEDLCKFNLSKIEIGLNCKIDYDSTYTKTQIVGFRSTSYKIMDGEGYRLFSTKTKDKTAKVYDKKNEIRSKMKLIKGVEELDFIKQSKDLNIFRCEFTIQNGKAKLKKELGIETIEDLITHYPRLLAYFLRNVGLFQLNDNSRLEFIPTKGTTKELTGYLLRDSINSHGAVGIRGLISQLAPKHRREARRRIKELQVNTGATNHLKTDIIQSLKKQSIDLFRNENQLGTNTNIKI